MLPLNINDNSQRPQGQRRRCHRLLRQSGRLYRTWCWWYSNQCPELERYSSETVTWLLVVDVVGEFRRGNVRMSRGEGLRFYTAVGEWPRLGVNEHDDSLCWHIFLRTTQGSVDPQCMYSLQHSMEKSHVRMAIFRSGRHWWLIECCESHYIGVGFCNNSHFAVYSRDS